MTVANIYNQAGDDYVSYADGRSFAAICL